MGGEGAHGMLVLGPRAVERLESYAPPWPLPKIFRMTKGGKLIGGIFEGETINTPSMLCVADWVVALEWARDIGGLTALRARADANAAVDRRLGRTHALGASPRRRARDALQHLGVPDAATARRACRRRWPSCSTPRASPSTSAPTATRRPGLRIWCGGTVETADLEALMPWLDWACAEAAA